MPEQTHHAGKAPLEDGRQSEPTQSASKKAGNRTDARGSTWRVQPRLPRFLIAGLPPTTPDEVDGLFEALEREPDVRFVKRISPARRSGDLANIAWAGSPYPEVAVVEMPVARAVTVARWPHVIIEPDLPLAYNAPPTWGAGLAQPDPSLVVPLREPMPLRIAVQDTEGSPVAGALVTVVGTTATTHGLTGSDGRVTLLLVADTPTTVRSVVVRPTGWHWGIRIDAPSLSSDTHNAIVLTSLTENGEVLTQRQQPGWGLGALRLADIPPTYRGHRVKIALLDSGIATSHPELKAHVATGIDIVGGTERGWDVDASGHGTWCAGIIAGEQDSAGIAGIAADAELHAINLFPGGYTSDLIAALDYCIEAGIDLAQINLTTGAASELAAWKLRDAYAAGVACIAGAGDHAGPVAFPADSVAAAYETPPHTPDGYFVPAFTAIGGPGVGVDLCAPGVAIPTAAPPDGYTVVDGTGVAAAHVTGLAALVLAHHTDFRELFGVHDAARVDRLFALLRASCTPIPVDDSRRTGAGLPDARRALNLTFEGSLYGYQPTMAWSQPFA